MKYYKFFLLLSVTILSTLIFVNVNESSAVLPPYRDITGENNHETNTSWGKAGEQLRRSASSDYGDGIETPAGASLILLNHLIYQFLVETILLISVILVQQLYH